MNIEPLDGVGKAQQVIAHETDVPATVDPFAGSYVVESMTDRIEEEARAYIEAIDERGGAVAAIEDGYQKGEIERAAYDLAKRIDAEEQVVVGVNRYQLGGDPQPELQRIDEAIREQQIERLDTIKRERDQAAVDRALAEVRSAAEGDDNLLPPMREALRRRATLQEVCDELRDVFGGYVPRDAF
jgi:methylmalonyl-CoA mutase N-terminal domain/subunit